MQCEVTVQIWFGGSLKILFYKPEKNSREVHRVILCSTWLRHGDWGFYYKKVASLVGKGVNSWWSIDSDCTNTLTRWSILWVFFPVAL